MPTDPDKTRSLRWFHVKVAIVVVGALSGLPFSLSDDLIGVPIYWKDIILVLFVVPLASLFVVGIQAYNTRSAKYWRKPAWDINPFTFREPLQLFHVAVFFFLAGGITRICALLIADGRLSPEGLLIFAAGFGLWIGIQLAVVVFRQKMGGKPYFGRRE